MLEGINVLSETTKWTANGTHLVFGIIFVAIALGFLVDYICNHKDIAHTLSLAGCLIIGYISIIVISGYINRIPYTEYKVTIEDSINLIEFENRYEILGKDGAEYIVRER